jgi:alkyldihydroxyacetonephosphate synthase
MSLQETGGAIARAIGADRVATDEASLHERRHDYWAVKRLRDFLGQGVTAPGMVVRPRTVADVQAIVRIAGEAGAPLMPFGLGSGVCGGVEPTAGTIILDMGDMNQIRSINLEDSLASFDAGVNGLVAEEAVAAHGLTIGHWPQSVAISSVGGWVSTRASGQFSTAYGNIEDVVYSIEAVMPDASLVTLGKAPRAAAGPDLRHMIMGAEGTMGVVTGVTFSLRDQPARRAFTAFYVRDMDHGFALQRAIIKVDWRPPVMRLYDAREVARMFSAHDRDGQALLLMVHEGPVARVEAELGDMARIAEGQGASAADPAAVEAWMERRNHVPTWTSLFERNIVADTIEISATWSQIGAVYRDAIASLREIPGLLNASAHSSHVYRSGINLYFSFAVRRDDTAELEGAYFEAWRRVLEATVKHGGGIAHHHGSGRVRRDFLVHDLGEAGVALLRKVKAALDPRGIMNPGNLLPDA